MADREVLQSLADVARAIFRAQAASVAVLDDDGGFVFEAVSGRGDWLVGARFAAGEGIAGEVARTGEPAHVRDLASDDRFARAFAERTGFVPTEMIVAPLGNPPRGVISVLDAGENRDGVATLAAFASIAALAL